MPKYKRFMLFSSCVIHHYEPIIVADSCAVECKIDGWRCTGIYAF